MKFKSEYDEVYLQLRENEKWKPEYFSDEYVKQTNRDIILHKLYEVCTLHLDYVLDKHDIRTRECYNIWKEFVLANFDFNTNEMSISQKLIAGTQKLLSDIQNLKEEIELIKEENKILKDTQLQLDALINGDCNDTNIEVNNAVTHIVNNVYGKVVGVFEDDGQAQHAPTEADTEQTQPMPVQPKTGPIPIPNRLLGLLKK